MKYLICFISALLLLGNALSAQTFSRAYGTPNSEEEGLCLLPINADTLLIAGTKGDSTQLLLVSPNGTLLSNQTFKFSRSDWKDFVTDIKLDSQNRVFATGFGDGPGGNDFQGFAFRYDYRNGQLLWSNIWDEAADGFSILEYAQGQYMVFGEDRDITNPGQNGLMARIDTTNGNISNSRQYSLLLSETFRSAVYLNNAFYTAGRFMFGQNNDRMRASMARLDANGNILNSRSFFAGLNPEDTLRFYSMDLDPFHDDHLLMVSRGFPVDGGTPAQTIYLSMHDDTTGLSWAYQYDIDGSYSEIPFDVVQLEDSILILGRFQNSATPAFIMKTDTTGVVGWCRGYSDHLRLPSGVSNNRMVVWNNSIYMTGATRKGTERNIALVRAQLDGTLLNDCNTSEYNVVAESNSVSFPNDLVDSLSTVADIPSILTPDTANLESTLICGSEPTPCFAATDPLFTKIIASQTLTGENIWDGKVYLGDSVIISVTGNNAVLDLTNVDVVFGECAGIDFVDGGALRANNSVFRPCDPNRSWRGFRFAAADSSFLHECTFKNAQRGLYFEGGLDEQTPLHCRVTNNLFVNNRTGIESRMMSITGAVSGNTFAIDGQPINFSPENCPLNQVYMNDHWGIRSNHTIWEALISQNDFINGRSESDAVDLYGILAVMSSGTISNNQFSNAFRGVELSECCQVSVENNRFEATNTFLDLENQIRASSGCSWLRISGNHLVNSNGNWNGFAGIYVDESSIVDIKGNWVEGFAQGIQIRNLSTAQVAENELNGNQIYGIYQENGYDVDVNCNRIHMAYIPGPLTFGIGYIHASEEASNNRIRSNCVWDSRIALLTNSNANSPLPAIRNNYFYNYELAGVWNLGCTGSIGTQLNIVTTAGRNTFRSNNVASTNTFAALDITSTVPITVSGNTGISNVDANVSVNGLNLFGSTAACGNQAGNVNAEYLLEDICDQFDGQVASAITALEGEDFSMFDQLSGMKLYNLSKAWMAHFDLNGQSDLAAKIKSRAQQALLPELARRLEITHLWQSGDYQEATAFLRTTEANDGLMALARAEDALRGTGLLSDAQVGVLRQWPQFQDTWADKAGDLLHFGVERTDYRFREVTVPDFKSEERFISIGSARATLFPNPNDGKFQLEYVLGQGNGGRVEVLDPQGRMLLEQNLDSQVGIASFDLTSLPKGIYFLRLLQGESLVDTQKWIKLK